MFNLLKCYRAGVVRLTPLPLGTQQKANITGRTTRGGPYQFAYPPYDYKNKPLRTWNLIGDSTLVRMSEDNAKIICVDGPIAAGKKSLCEALAVELDMYHMKKCSMDDYWINKSGFDMRELDPKLPELCRSFDVRDFLENPGRQPFTVRYAAAICFMRTLQYMDAMIHLLNTGQGVILERNIFSDVAFYEAMLKEGYISIDAYKMLMDILESCYIAFRRPHVVIYLDVPVPIVQERIQKRAISYEVNSPALTTSYLTNLENGWKRYLKNISKHAEVLVYDWSSGGEADVVVEDLEKIDFEAYFLSYPNRKMHDWHLKRRAFARLREALTTDRSYVYREIVKPFKYIDVPDMFMDPHDADEYWQVVYDAPGMKRPEGFDPSRGDNVWLKVLPGFKYQKHIMGW